LVFNRTVSLKEDGKKDWAFHCDVFFYLSA
jgi:hypothetical protein